MDVIVVGAGPAGIFAALRAKELGARTALVTRDALGGMAANDGPVPVRTLAHAARLMREARQLGQYGIAVGEPALDYARLLERVRDVVQDVRTHSIVSENLERLGVTLYERAGMAHFVDPHTIETETGLVLKGAKIILCTGGTSRRLTVPGSELTATHSDAWELKSIPPSMLVIGAGATGVQVASIFNEFGSQVQLFHAGVRILPTEDGDVSEAVATAFREAGIKVWENFGAIDSFEKTRTGVRMYFSKDNIQDSAEATLAVVAIGWQVDASALRLSIPGVETNSRGFVQVDSYGRTSAPHIFAAGDITGHLMLVPQAIQGGFVAATNAVRGATMTLGSEVNPISSFTDPEYAQVGLTEAQARETHDVVVSKVNFDSTTRTIIDGRTSGFCKLITDKATRTILGCHVVGERAGEIVQVAAIGMAGKMTVDDLSRIPLSFPTYTGILGIAALVAIRQISPEGDWQANRLLP